MTVEPPPMGRLRWRTRRGLRELDMVLQRYLKDVYPNVSAEEQAAFADLLEQNDSDMLDWLLGRRLPPEHLTDVIRALSPDH